MNNSAAEPRCVLRLPKVTDWCTLNERIHWRERHRRRTEWREATIWHARAQNFPRNQQPALIVPIFVFPTVRRRDRGNFVATTKVIIDALCTGPKKDPATHGYGAWPDDDDRYLEERMPVFHEGKGLTPGVIIRVYDR